MEHRWLAFLSIAGISLLVFVLFWYRNQPIPIPSSESIDVTQSLTEPTVTFVNPHKGAEEPALTIVTFGDFQCDACGTLATSLDVMVKTFPTVTVVWKDMPNESAHELATPAAIAAHCADQQGRFWEYHDALFAQSDVLSEGLFAQIAQQLNLNTERFQTCYDQRDTLPIIKKDYREGLALGITATPTTYVGDEIIVGAASVEELTTLITRLMTPSQP
jgi:protein-disulfide isomerase